MKRILFHFLKTVSYIIRPLRHGFYMRILEFAYKTQGVTFKGKACYIHHDVFIDNIGNVKIGSNVVISTKAIILAHDYSSKIKQLLYGGEENYIHKTIIGDNVFIGAGAIILPNTVIGNYCIIGAGAVVKGNIPDYSVVIGNPCKIIKSIKNNIS